MNIMYHAQKISNLISTLFTYLCLHHPNDSPHFEVAQLKKIAHVDWLLFAEEMLYWKCSAVQEKEKRSVFYEFRKKFAVFKTSSGKYDPRGACRKNERQPSDRFKMGAWRGVPRNGKDKWKISTVLSAVFALALVSLKAWIKLRAFFRTFKLRRTPKKHVQIGCESAEKMLYW